MDNLRETQFLSVPHENPRVAGGKLNKSKGQNCHLLLKEKLLLDRSRSHRHQLLLAQPYSNNGLISYLLLQLAEKKNQTHLTMFSL